MRCSEGLALLINRTDDLEVCGESNELKGTVGKIRRAHRPRIAGYQPEGRLDRVVERPEEIRIDVPVLVLSITTVDIRGPGHAPARRDT